MSTDIVKQKRNEYQREWRKNNIDKLRIIQQRYRDSHRSALRAYALSPKAKGARKEYNIQLKMDVLSHYGNGKCACVKCGFDDIRALSIDHINGNGRKHTRIIGGGHFYTWLKLNNFPEGFQTLCFNCNWIKRIERREGKEQV